MRAEQTVCEMVVESLARRAEALSEGSGMTFEDAFSEVLRTPAGRQLAELADGPHRHEKAAEWQTGLLAEREARRPAHLRETGSAAGRYTWHGFYEEGTDECEEYYAFLGERFATM